MSGYFRRPALPAELAALAADLANAATSTKGGGQVGWGVSVPYALTAVGGAINAVYSTTTARTAPHANFNWFTADFTVVGCAGPGRAVVQQDLRDVFLTKYAGAMNGALKYVAPASVGGSDSNAGDSWASPYLTIDKALRTVLCGTIYLWPGSYGLPSFRYTDTGGTQPKRVIAPFGGVTIAELGDTISAATWTANATFINVYETTLVTANYVTRVLLATNLDKWGLPIPLPKQASLLTVDSSAYGWWYDSVTKKLYVRKGVENINTVTKANLSAVYAAAGDNQILLYSSTSYWENITFHGYLNILKLAGQAVPEGWFRACTFKFAEGNSRNVYGGGCYSQDCIAYRSTADHANYNTASATTAYGVEINDDTRFAGDVETFGSGATQPNNPIASGQNKNGTSNHDGYVVRINGVHADCYGPPIADTAGSYSWCMGTRTGYSYATAGGSQKIGFIMQGNQAWIDGCGAGPGLDAGVNADASAAVRIFNTQGVQLATTGGTFTRYAPV